jgi:hypothetical protein
MVTLELHDSNTGNARPVQVEGFVKASGTICAKIIDGQRVCFVQVRMNGKVTCKDEQGQACNYNDTNTYAYVAQFANLPKVTKVDPKRSSENAPLFSRPFPGLPMSYKELEAAGIRA